MAYALVIHVPMYITSHASYFKYLQVIQLIMLSIVNSFTSSGPSVKYFPITLTHRAQALRQGLPPTTCTISQTK